MKRHTAIPKDFPVQPLKPGQEAKDKATCGYCGLSWDDAIPTSYTPAPSARCPFEYFHVHPEPPSFQSLSVDVPECDFDLTINFPSGAQVVIQGRPSNADLNYNGSLDIILPQDQAVTNWQGDDMEAARPVRGQAHTRIAKQLVTELP